MMFKKWIRTSVVLCVGLLGACSLDQGESSETTEQKLVSQVFSGIVRDGTGAPIAGARVTINGIVRLTNSNGKYAVSIGESRDGYRLDIRKNGFGPLTEFRLKGALGLDHQMQRAFVKAIQPNIDNVIVDPSSGIRVFVPANSLRSNSGIPAGAVSFSILAMSSQTMPGDFSAQNALGKRVALVSVGAATLQAVDSQGNTLGLVPGASITVDLPVPSSAGGKMPDCVLTGTCRAAMWRFDPATALWVEQPTATNFGTQATTFTVRNQKEQVIDPDDGLGTWNADIEFVEPACTVIEFTSVPLDCYNPPPGATPEPGIEVKFTQALAGGGTKSKTSAVLSSASFLLLYNLRPNIDVDLSFMFPPGAPPNCAANLSITSVPAPNPGFPVYSPTGGMTQLSTGAPWGGTGYPINSGGSPVNFTDVVTGDHPCNSYVQVTTSL